MINGWIKLHRKLVCWGWYKNSNMVHLFIHLLISANNKDGEYQGQVVKRGQVLSGRNSLKEATGISAQTIRTCLKRLKSSNEIVVKSTNRFSIITICNYEDYQQQKKPSQPATNQQLTSNQPATNHKQEGKEVKKVKKRTNKKKHGEFKNVLLTEQEYSKLKEKFNSSAGIKIDVLSEYMARVGKTYKSHYLTILKWAKNDETKTKTETDKLIGMI